MNSNLSGGIIPQMSPSKMSKTSAFTIGGAEMRSGSISPFGKSKRMDPDFNQAVEIY